MVAVYSIVYSARQVWTSSSSTAAHLSSLQIQAVHTRLALSSYAFVLTPRDFCIILLVEPITFCQYYFLATAAVSVDGVSTENDSSENLYHINHIAFMLGFHVLYIETFNESRTYWQLTIR